MALATRISSARAALSASRAERAGRRRLSAELAAFVTPAERAELDLILGRHTAEESREVRAILDRQALARLRHPLDVGGGFGR